MPTYEYQGFDNQGRSQSGVLIASSANDAISQLARSGLRVQKVTPRVQDDVSLSRQTVSSVAGAPPVMQGGGQAVSQSVQTSNQAQKGSKSAFQTYGNQETMFLRDADLNLFFIQLANLFRAGIAPAEAFGQMAQRQSVKRFVQEACADISKMTASGMSLADAMQKYPDLFPPGAVGAVRAGETGGYLWEACDAFAQNQNKAKGLRRIFFWASLAWWSTILTIPVFFILKQGITRLMGSINDTSSTPISQYGEGLRSALFGLPGLLFLVVLFGYFFGWRIFGRRQFLKQRHELAARIWTIKKRAVSDSLKEFSFHLQKLTRSGISPMRAFTLAADAVPNRYHAEQLLRKAQGANESTRLSQLLYQSEVFPPDYVPLVETGEMTGQTESALNEVGNNAASDRDFHENFLKFRAFIWAGLLVVCGSCVLYALLSRTMFDEAWKAVFEGVPF